jgi:hypothetical protein
MNEIWKDIVNYEGFYSVSTLGRIRNNRNEHFLIPSLTTKGYGTVVCMVKNRRKKFSIHRLVATTFIPNIYNKPQINHLNGIKTDNRTINLEWVTQTENLNHAFKNNIRHDQGENHYKHKLSDTEVIKIRELRLSGLYCSKIAKLYNVTESCIYNITTGKTRKNAIVK